MARVRRSRAFLDQIVDRTPIDEKALSELFAAGLADGTKRDYLISVRSYERLLSDLRVEPFPVTEEKLLTFMTRYATNHKPGTVVKAAFGIGYLSGLAGWGRFTDDRKGKVFRLIQSLRKRMRADRPRATFEQVLKVARSLPAETPRQRRDRAIFLLIAVNGLKPGQLRVLDRSRVTTTTTGLELATDSFSVDVGRGLDPATDPVDAVLAWLDDVGREPGPLFPAAYFRKRKRLQQVIHKVTFCDITKQLTAKVLGVELTPIMLKRTLVRRAVELKWSTKEIMEHCHYKSLGAVLHHTGERGKPHETSLRIQLQNRRRTRRCPPR